MFPGIRRFLSLLQVQVMSLVFLCRIISPWLMPWLSITCPIVLARSLTWEFGSRHATHRAGIRLFVTNCLTSIIMSLCSHISRWWTLCFSGLLPKEIPSSSWWHSSKRSMRRGRARGAHWKLRAFFSSRSNRDLQKQQRFYLHLCTRIR